MGLFMKDGKVKGSLIIISFTFSLLFLVIFRLVYPFVAMLLAITMDSYPGEWLGSIIPAILASGICCLFMIPFREKRTVPCAFLFLSVFLMLFDIMPYGLFETPQALLIFKLPPIVLGNLMSWGIYFLTLRKDKREQVQSPACE